MSTQPVSLTTSHDPGGKVKISIPDHWETKVEFSECDRYRYKLMRRWSGGPLAMFLMMNCSTADISKNDPSIHRCCGFAQSWGYGGLYIGNVCAYRSTSPSGLLAVPDPVGPGNLTAILEMAQEASLIVVAHGTLPKGLQLHAGRAVAALRAAGHKLHYLKLSKLGHPVHPLYLSKELKPTVWI